LWKCEEAAVSGAGIIRLVIFTGWLVATNLFEQYGTPVYKDKFSSSMYNVRVRSSGCNSSAWVSRILEGYYKNMRKIIAVLNQKGGVGKTTTAINVGAYLAMMGRTVLLVDLDPQGNATSGLGYDKESLDATMYDVLFGEAEATHTALETKIEGLSLLPTNAQLAAAEVDLAAETNRELKLKTALAPVVYDYVLIDCPPALSLLTINALTAADYVLIPVQAEYYALEGLSQLLSVVQQVRGGLNPRLELLGVVITMYDGRTSLSDQVTQEVRKHFGNKVYDTVIPRNVRLAEAPSHGKSIAEHDKWSKGARSYKQLAKELDKKIGKEQ
jgi:chromosome partitioning protein